MLLTFSVLLIVVSAVPNLLARPSLDVPACPVVGTLSYNSSVPDQGLFPRTQVDLCYDDSSIQIRFTAFEEKNFYYNQSLTTNGEIYNYEVMEVFITMHRGTNDPQTYLEFEVAPNNVTFQAFIYNPSKSRVAGAAFDRFYITDLAADGVTARTTLDYAEELWVSNVQIPLGLFNVDSGAAQGIEWRMNFFRTVTSSTTFPTQIYGSWSPPDQVNFHITPVFGDVTFV